MKVGFLGSGLMGFPMAQRLLLNNHQVIVYNRTLSKAQPLQKDGAEVATSAHEVIEKSQCIILMLADAKAIQEILFSQNILSFAGKTVIQMGTIAPSESIQFKQLIEQKQGQYFECPVLGSIKEAKEGKLHLMVGATQDQYEQWKVFLKCFGQDPKHIGEVGQAAALKLAMNQLIASLVTAFSLSLSLVQHFGIRVDDFMDILRKSALYAPMFDNKLPRMLKKDYSNPNFSTKHMLKDINLFLQEAENKGIATVSLEDIQQIFSRTIQKGFAETDYSAVFDIIYSDKN